MGRGRKDMDRRKKGMNCERGGEGRDQRNKTRRMNTIEEEDRRDYEGRTSGGRKRTWMIREGNRKEGEGRHT